MINMLNIFFKRKDRRYKIITNTFKYNFGAEILDFLYKRFFLDTVSNKIADVKVSDVVYGNGYYSGNISVRSGDSKNDFYFFVNGDICFLVSKREKYNFINYNVFYDEKNMIFVHEL